MVCVGRAGDRGRGSNYVHGAAKAGFTAFLSGLRNRLAKAGVRVVTVKPGFVRTKMTAGLKEAPLTVDKQDVAEAAVDAALNKQRYVFVPKAFGPISFALQHIPAPIMRRLNF